MPQQFEWDSAKAAENERKHGVTFEQARLAFENPNSVEWRDIDLVYGEERFVLLGRTGAMLMKVIYTERDEASRIISAREATRNEHRRYQLENDH